MAQTKILIVDDDPGIGEMLKTLLEFNGFEAFVSEKPEETSENILNLDIDIVLLDMLISGVNGTDVCAELRKNEATETIPVLMMSALHDAGNKCRSAGANDFISKPFEMDELMNRINALLEESKNS